MPVINSNVAVVHLALKSYGRDPLRRFIDSYRNHPAGTEHRLILAMKGFRDEAEAKGFVGVLESIEYDIVLVPNKGLDIGTYVYIARLIDNKYLCFFNSRSAINADNWLAKLISAARLSGVGAVGATGSFQGIATDMWRKIPTGRSWPRLRRIKRAVMSSYMSRLYPHFPNPHLRTNAFLIARDLFLSLDLPVVRRKSHAMRFESGWNSLTRQLMARDLQPVVVDREGRVRPVAEWPSGDLFWMGDQRNLMATDNQTEYYAMADIPTRRWLTHHAWEPLGPRDANRFRLERVAAWWRAA